MDKSANRTETQRYLKSVFNENPYDIETFFEGLEIMADNGKEIFFVDKSRNEDFIKTFPEMARLLNYE